MKQVDAIIHRADEELSNGRKWRAKEILQSSIHLVAYPKSTNGDNILAVYQRLGEVLSEMGDDLEAGKYLFLSGNYRPEDSSCVELFVKRYARSQPINLYWTFPKAARLPSTDQYPENVRDTLVRLGIPTNLTLAQSACSCTKLSWKHKVILSAVIFTLVIPWLVGIVALLTWMF